MALFNTPKTPADALKTPAKGGKPERAPDVMMPEGTHKAKVAHVIPKTTSTGKIMFSLKWMDEFDRSAWQNIIISPESEKAMKFFYGRLMPVFGLTQAIIEADDTTPDDIANDMTGTDALVTVEHEEWNGKKGAKVRWLDAEVAHQGGLHHGHEFVSDDLGDQGHPSYTCAICGKRKAEHSDGSTGVGVEPPRRVHQPVRESDRPNSTAHNQPTLDPEAVAADPLQVAAPLGEQQIDPGPLHLGQIPAVDPRSVTEPAHTHDDPTTGKKPA